MPRPRDHVRHVSIAVEDLVRSVTRLVDSVSTATKGRNGSVKTASPSPTPRGPGKGNPKLKSKLKAYWASLSPQARKARIAKMHAWRKK